MKKRTFLILLAVMIGPLCLVGTSKAADVDTLLEMNTGYRVGLEYCREPGWNQSQYLVRVDLGRP